MDAAKNKLFMELVVPWPGSVNAPGWVNLHCHLKNTNPAIKGGKDFVVGWPFKTVDDFLSRAAWVQTTAQFFDVWYCTSQQRDHDVNPTTKKPKAKRLASNATWLKAIWIDCDVKAGDAAHYGTDAEASNALGAFCKNVGLPKPSAVVHSGGGLHVYWISDTAMSPEDWRPYAEGLKALLLRDGVKCDTGLTTDCVRILRVPGTLNHKYSPPRTVELLHLGQVYKFGTDLSFLKKFAGTHSSSNATQNTVTAPVEPGWTAVAPDPAFAGLTVDNALQAGVEPTGPMLVDPAPIFEKCAFLSDALANGGKDYDNPLWNLSVLCTAFMENGNALAHEVSKGHASYSPPDTQALYDRKVADRAERGIGYPSCAAIAGAGCKACQTCPLLKNGKSPLNIRPKPATVTATVTRPPQAAGAVTLNLPDGYDLDANNVICEIARNKDDDEIWLPLFHNTIYDAWLQKEPDVIHIRCSYDKGNTIWTAIRVEDLMGPGYEKKLGAAKLLYTKHKARLETFFMAWVDTMRRAAEAQTPQAFGWYRENGQRKGFAYGGSIFRDDGTVAPAGLTDRTTQKRFQPTGESKPWYAAADYILRQQRADLDVIIATSFAAPLIEMTGASGAMLSAWGESGVGKTYALEVGAGVWGHPKESKETTKTSANSFEQRMGATVNLPVYWDEITDEAAQKNAFSMLMVATGGVVGGKLTQNREQRDKNTWATLVSINSNLCFKEYVSRCQPTHTAGLNRVLEYEVLRSTSPVGRVSGSEAAKALGDVYHNYGTVGLEYAKVLGADHLAIQARVDSVLKNLEQILKPSEEDRFWISTMAVIIVGAETARDRLNVPFDLERITDFLIKVYDANKVGRVEANVATTTMDYAEDFLTTFLKEHNMSSIWVDNTPAAPGRHTTIRWRLIRPNAPIPNGVHVRYDQTAQTIMISKPELKKWLEINRPKVSPSSMIKSLKTNYGAVEAKKKINAGTPFAGGQEHVLILDASNNQDLLDEVNRQMEPDNSALGASVGMSASAVDTGIAPTDEQVTPNANS